MSKFEIKDPKLIAEIIDMLSKEETKEGERSIKEFIGDATPIVTIELKN